MGLLRSEKVKLDVTKGLFNAVIAGLRQYISAVDDDESAEAKQVLDSIIKYAWLETDDDGTEYAIVNLYSSEACELIYALAIVASADFVEIKDEYSQIKAARE